MWKAAFRGLLERKLRLALTMLSIVLGVGFVAGTYILTDSISKGFEEIFEKANAGFDVFVRTKRLVRVARTEPIPESVLGRVQEVEGVRAAAGSLEDEAQILDKKGEPIGGQGPPTLAIATTDPKLSRLKVKAGRLPRNANEVGMDTATAKRNSFSVGEKIGAIVSGSAKDFELVSTIEFEGLEDLGGATLLLFEIDAGQSLFGREGSFDSIEVVAESTVLQSELRDRIDAALPDTYEAVARDVLVDEIVAEIREAIGFLTAALLPFGFVGLFVGGFGIFNTFSILFAQRVREFALLRAVGASSSQVLRTVMTEALLLGVLASVLGLGFGVVLVEGLKRLLEAFGIDLPTSGSPILPRTIAVSLALGIFVTLAAAIFPAIRVRKVAPVAALREGAVIVTRHSARRRNVIGLIVTGAGAGLILFGGFAGDQRLVPAGQVLQVLGAGAVVLFLGIALVSPLLARPLARAIGWPVAKVFGLGGRIARANAMRDPARTAATAAALMIGVALVTFVSAFASSSKASVARRISERVRADFAVDNVTDIRLSPEVAQGLEALPEVKLASGLSFEGYLLDGSLTGAIGVDQNRIEELLFLDIKEGDLRNLKEDGVFVRQTLAEEKGWRIGTRVRAQFPRGEEQELIVKGIYAGGPSSFQGGSGGGFSAQTLIGRQRFEQGFVEQEHNLVYGSFEPGVSSAQGTQAVKAALTPYPNAQFFDQAGLIARQEDQIDQLLGLINALLGLALVIALFGIVNTLALSIFERVREIGLLRAIGVTRRQIRSIVRWESVIVAMMGVTLGIAVGILFFFLLIVQGQQEDGLDFVIPVGRLAVYALTAALGGVLAAVLPARRAARLDVLRAIAYE